MKLLILFMTLASTCLLSCKNGTQKVNENALLLGQKVFFSKTVSAFTIIDSLKRIDNLHIIIYIDSSQCTPCSINDIILWEKHNDFLSQNDINISLIFGTKDHDLISDLMTKYYISYPYIIDENRILIKENPFLSNESFRTFVINNEQSIIWLGNPNYSKKTWNLFTNMLKSYKNENKKNY
ncbi:hypothetical protein [Phocaeicola sp.]